MCYLYDILSPLYEHSVLFHLHYIFGRYIEEREEGVVFVHFRKKKKSIMHIWSLAWKRYQRIEMSKPFRDAWFPTLISTQPTGTKAWFSFELHPPLLRKDLQDDCNDTASRSIDWKPLHAWYKFLEMIWCTLSKAVLSKLGSAYLWGYVT